MSQSRERVIPYVEDTRNVLLLTPSDRPEPEVMATLGAALKSAIQAEYQLEDSELAVEAAAIRGRPAPAALLRGRRRRRRRPPSTRSRARGTRIGRARGAEDLPLRR